jgi:hypothetical protein
MNIVVLMITITAHLQLSLLSMNAHMDTCYGQWRRHMDTWAAGVGGHLLPLSLSLAHTHTPCRDPSRAHTPVAFVFVVGVHVIL